MDANSLHLHVPVLGWLFVVTNALLLATGLVGLVLLVGIGAAVQDPMAFRILSIIGTAGLVFFALMALPGIAAGIGLLRRRHWGRTLALVVGILGLAAFPIGTALGIYAFFVLLQSGAGAYFGLTDSPSTSPAA
jgi:hypothetical protein